MTKEFYVKNLNKVVKGWVAEHKFCSTRKWRFDYANPTKKIAIEIDGGCFIRGRHSRGMGQIKDMEKGNEAIKLGWRVLHYPPQRQLQALDDVAKII